VSGVTIYMEGGGDSKDQKAQLRQGMSQFLATLKEKARAKNWKWKLTLCGGRQTAYEAFLNGRRQPAAGELIVLLVDSEAPVTAASRAAHLRARVGDGWDLTGVPEDHIHLMVQAMEAWIVADPEALADYYGQKFQRNALPTRPNLEEEPKADCANKLSAATRPTQKGEYQKIRHAADLLARISSEKVRSRCPHAEIMFSTLHPLIA
jgi:hypothetical protein